MKQTMTKMTKRIGLAVALLVLVLGGTLMGGSWYLLDYALKPESQNRNEEWTWHRMDSVFPGLQAWRDSLQRSGCWHDTLITATDGARMHAFYVKNPTPTRRTAVLVHGYTDCAVEMMHLGRMYERDMGANILVPDLRNAGKTEGDCFQMGWLDRLDVKQWVKLVPELFGDSATVVVHGISMGAATTMMLSGEPDVPDYVRAYVEDCGYTSVDDQFSKELKEQYGLPRFPLIPAASALCQLRYGWGFAEASALRQVARCPRPMLFIHGSADKYVPTWMVYPLYKAHKGVKELWISPDVPHARSYELCTREYTQRVRTFLNEKTDW